MTLTQAELESLERVSRICFEAHDDSSTAEQIRAAGAAAVMFLGSHGAAIAAALRRYAAAKPEGLSVIEREAVEDLEAAVKQCRDFGRQYCASPIHFTQAESLLRLVKRHPAAAIGAQVVTDAMVERALAAFDAAVGAAPSHMLTWVGFMREDRLSVIRAALAAALTAALPSPPVTP